jgi:hypothetical protein
VTVQRVGKIRLGATLSAALDQCSKLGVEGPRARQAAGRMGFGKHSLNCVTNSLAVGLLNEPQVSIPVAIAFQMAESLQRGDNTRSFDKRRRDDAANNNQNAYPPPSVLDLVVFGGIEERSYQGHHQRSRSDWATDVAKGELREWRFENVSGCVEIYEEEKNGVNDHTQDKSNRAQPDSLSLVLCAILRGGLMTGSWMLSSPALSASLVVLLQSHTHLGRNHHDGVVAIARLFRTPTSPRSAVPNRPARPIGSR